MFRVRTANQLRQTKKETNVAGPGHQRREFVLRLSHTHKTYTTKRTKQNVHNKTYTRKRTQHSVHNKTYATKRTKLWLDFFGVFWHLVKRMLYFFRLANWRYTIHLDCIRNSRQFTWMASTWYYVIRLECERTTRNQKVGQPPDQNEVKQWEYGLRRTNRKVYESVRHRHGVYSRCSSLYWSDMEYIPIVCLCIRKTRSIFPLFVSIGQTWRIFQLSLSLLVR